MTKKERIKAIIKGESIDYLPSNLNFVTHRLDKLLEEMNMDLEDLNNWLYNHLFYLYPLTDSYYYSSGSKEDQKLINLAIDKGLIEEHQDERFIYDNFNVSWFKNIDGVRNVGYPLKNKNLGAFHWPDPTSPHIFDHILADLNKYSSEYCIVGMQQSTLFERAQFLFGYQNLMLELATDIDFVEELLDRILEYQIKLAHRFINFNIDVAFTGDDYGMQDGMQISPKLWRRVFKPRLAKIWEVYHNAGIPVMHHTCGNVEEIIPDFIEMGLSVLHPIQPIAMDIEKLAQRFGRKIVFFGGIDTQRLLPFGKRHEIFEAVRHCVEVLGRDGKYIIGPSQVIMNDVSTENIKALVEGIKKYRKIKT